MLESENEYLFVYGTLRQGLKGPARRILARFSTFEGKGSFRGRLYDTGDFPAAVPSDDSGDRVIGEIYRMLESDELLRTLDSYEGFDPHADSGNLFNRKMVDVEHPDGKTVKAWVYLYNRPVEHCKHISSGDYLAYLEEQQ
ncbi:MAG: gamma-glutamylcyclotransferase family protein [Balneolaceae bacterium]|nr:gamma-glutamylcyclotransferase family protein [Balneolaceae bacterium]